MKKNKQFRIKSTILLVSTVAILLILLTSCGKSIEIELPALPQTVKHYPLGGTALLNEVEITSIKYEVNGDSVTILLSGKRTGGFLRSGICRGGYELRDSQGAIVAKGIFRTPEISTGERFANVTIEISNLDTSEIYTFILKSAHD